MRKKAACAAALLAAGVAVVSAQAGARPQVTFRAEVNYVEVDVIVTDAAGNFVPGLTAADFDVLDAGKPQAIEAFHEINVPLARADQPIIGGAPVAQDVASNEGLSEGRLFVIVLDDFHTAPWRSNEVQRRAKEFVTKYLAANDLAAVVQVSRPGRAQDFTANRALLLEAIDSFIGSGLQSAVRNRIQDMENRRGTNQAAAPGRDLDGGERVSRARAVYSTIEQLSANLASITGRRKALLLFSEGVSATGDLALPDSAVDANDTRGTMIGAIAAATRANVHVYAVDTGGMTTGVVSAADATMPFNERAEAEGLTTEALAAERNSAEAMLRVVSQQTGGTAVVDTNNITAGFARIQRDNSAYYLLGFSSTAPRDGKFHGLQVKVKRPGLVVRARPGYHAAKVDSARTKPTARAPLADLLSAALSDSGLPLRVAAPVFRRDGNKATALLAVELAPDVFRFEPEGGGFAEDAHIAYQLIDDDGKVVSGDAHDFEMRLSQATRDLVQARGFRAVFPLTVEPGRYQVRVAAQLKNAARRGSVFLDLVVPDLPDERLVWSGVSLTSTSAAAVPTRPADAETGKLIPLMPSAARTFAAGDTLALYAEAYDNDRRAAHVVDLTVSVRDETGKSVFSTSEERSSASVSAGRGHALHLEVPLEGLPRGRYVLTLTARSRAGGNATAVQEIPFGVS